MTGINLVSSSQNQEDIMLWRALSGVENGFYIDVGAADPVVFSVTRLFYDHGWSGINLEPNPAYFSMLEAARPRDINLQIGAGAESGTMIFHIIEDTGLSTFDTAIAAHHAQDKWPVAEHPAEVSTLAEICRQHRPDGPIHFLKIDVEGFEGAVLAGGDFKLFRPWIVLVEATMPMSQQQSFQHWEPVLTGNAYSFVWFDGLNRFYIANEMRAELEKFFEVQPNVFDGFSNQANIVEQAENAERALAQTLVAKAKLEHALAESAKKEKEADAYARSAEAALSQTMDSLSRQSNLAIQAQDRCNNLLVLLAKERALLAKEREFHAEVSASHNESAARLTDRIAVLEADLVSARARAEIAESWCEAMAASTSWQLTAPVRMAGRFLRSSPSDSPEPSGPAAKPVTIKNFARKSFHLGVHGMLLLPGGRRISRRAYNMAPVPIEWLARRYRAYDGRLEPVAETPMTLDPPIMFEEQNENTVSDSDVVVEFRFLPIEGLSAAEARVCRQFANYIPMLSP